MNMSLVGIVRWDNVLFDRVISFGRAERRGFRFARARHKSVRLAYSAKRTWKFSLLEAQQRNSIGDPDVTPTMTLIFSLRCSLAGWKTCSVYVSIFESCPHCPRTRRSRRSPPSSLSHRQFNNSPLSRVIASNLSLQRYPCSTLSQMFRAPPFPPESSARGTFRVRSTGIINPWSRRGESRMQRNGGCFFFFFLFILKGIIAHNATLCLSYQRSSLLHL